MPKHVRHKPPSKLSRPRDLILACPQFRSGVNLARMVRLAGCAGVNKIIACGQNKIDTRIARNATEFVEIERRRSLTKRLKDFKAADYKLVALEQSDQSVDLFEYKFDQKTVLVIGHERTGVSAPDLELVDDVVEIQVYGQPFSYNVVTATTMVVYEYCRQFPTG